MKVAYVAESLESSAGGPAKSVPDLAAGLARSGVQVVALATQRAREERYELIDHYELVFHPSKIPWPLRAGILGRGYVAPGLPLRLAREARDADLIHFTGLWAFPAVCVWLTSAAYHVPLIYSPRASLYDAALRHHAGRKRVAWRLYARRLLDRCACIHATSENEVEQIRRAAGGRPIALVPNGVNTREFESIGSQQAARATLRLEPDRRYALFLARIHPRKRLDWLVRAWLALQEEFPEWDLLIAGHQEVPGHLASVVRLVEERGLASRVSYLGALGRSERALALRASDLFVVPTSFENFGTAISEALAAGLPVITTRGAPWQVVRDRGAGWWIEHSPDALQRALQEALSASPDQRCRMGRIGREIISAFSCDRLAQRMLEVYDWVLGRGPRPECVL